MSRIGNRKLAIPAGVTVEINDSLVTVKGQKGELKLNLAKNVNVAVVDNEIVVTRENDLIPTKKIHGTNHWCWLSLYFKR